MEIQEISDILNKRPKGSIYTLVVDRPGKVRKGVSSMIRKVSVMQGQICDYASRAPVKEAVAAGTRLEPETKSYIDEIFFEGNVRFWRGRNDQVYLTVPITGMKSKVTWYKDDIEVSLQEIEPLLLAEETRKRPTKEQVEDKGQAEFICVKLQNISEIR